MLVIKDKVLGIGRPLVCVPVGEGEKKDLLNKCKKAAKCGADMIEWRADYYLGDIFEPGLFEKMRQYLGNIPIMFTYRSSYEGGDGPDTDVLEYVDIIKKAAILHKPDLIDVEINIFSHLNDAEKDSSEEKTDMRKIIGSIKDYGIKVVGSFHDFESTPENDVMEKQFESMHSLGADILKIAVMPKDTDDVRRLISFSTEMNDKYDEPIITVSMGHLGAVTRIAGNITGSSVTFAGLKTGTAPGQIDISDIKVIMNKITGRHIYLIGYMGCGKSSVAKRLADRLGMKCTDTDDMAACMAGMKIPEIFEKTGEEYFRNLETEALIRLSKADEHVVACGGGIVLREENIAVMKKTGIVILLTAKPEEILRRVSGSSDRPLLNGNMNIEYIKDMLSNREPLYKKAADMIIGTDNVSVNDVVNDIFSYINKDAE